MNRQIFIFLGPPGSGKGSLSQKCINKLQWKQLSTGALCRKHIAEKTELGKQIEEAIRTGHLIEDDIIVQLVEQWLVGNQQEKVVVLDGFPRTLNQAAALQNMLRQRVSDCTLNVVRISVPDEVVLERMLNRLMCANNDCQTVYSAVAHSGLAPKDLKKCDVCKSDLIKRQDDDPHALKSRLVTYHQHEQSIIDFFKDSGRNVFHLNGEQGPEDVFVDFFGVCKSALIDDPVLITNISNQII